MSWGSSSKVNRRSSSPHLFPDTTFQMVRIPLTGWIHRCPLDQETTPVAGVVRDDAGGLDCHDRHEVSTVIERQPVLPRVRGFHGDPVAGPDGLHLLEIAAGIALLPDAIANEAFRLVVDPAAERRANEPRVIDTSAVTA